MCCAALAFAALRAQTYLVWDDTPHINEILFERNGVPFAYQSSLFKAIEDGFSRPTTSGYRPISAAIANFGFGYLIHGGSLFIWSLVQGVSIGVLGLVYYAVGFYFLESTAFSLLAVFLLLSSSVFVSSSWIVVAGIQAFVPIVVCCSILTYLNYEKSGYRSKGALICLGLIYLLAPWFREFAGCAAVLVFFADLLKRRKLTFVMLLSTLGLLHAIFPGAILHLIIDGAPAQSIFHLGSLGNQMNLGQGSGSASIWVKLLNLKWTAIGHLLNQIPTEFFILCALSLLIYIVGIKDSKPKKLQASAGRAKYLFLWFWLIITTVPFLKVFSEEIHLFYPLVPFCLIVVGGVQYLWDRAYPGWPRVLKVVCWILLLVGIADQGLNWPNSFMIISEMNQKIESIGRRLRETLPQNSIVISNALHLEDLRFASGGWFTSFWTVNAGVTYPNRSLMDLEQFVRFVDQHPQPIYFLDIHQNFLKEKREYHSHRLVQSPALIIRKVWDDRLEVDYPYFDLFKALINRRYTNVLFPPDLENDFYHGPRQSSNFGYREFSAEYTLYQFVKIK